MTELIFVRHGETEANAIKYLSKPDTVLTELGISQARKAGQELKDSGIKTIVCSPFIRAQQTAEIIAGELGIDIKHIRIIDELRERSAGKLEGTPKLHEGNWYDYYFGDEDFELVSDVIGRTEIALDKIKKLSSDGLVLVVGHAMAGLCLLQVVAGKTRLEEFDRGIRLENAQPVRVQIS